MSKMQNPRGRRRPSKSSYTTKSGTNITLNRSLSDRMRAKRDAKARRRAAYLSTLPKNRWKRFAYRLHPKRVAQYWFSREGGIMALKITGIGIVVVFLLLVGMFAYFRKDLPNIKDVSGNNLPGSISYYDRSGKVLLFQDYDAVKRIPVKGDQISQSMKNATVAIEDKNFYHEGAFNVRGITRAAIHDAIGSGGLQGGSTITQQLVKLNENWTGDRTITRKVKEVILAVELEREYSKSDILTGYLNIAPYGGIEYGAESAARDYFHTSAKDLTLSQSVFLSAIPQAPSYYSPYSSLFNKQALAGRMQYILDQMVQQHMITKDQAAAALKVNVIAEVHPLQAKYQGIKAPYFVLSAKQELEQKYGTQTVQRGGWRVTTTVNLTLQKLAEQAVSANLPNVQQYGGDEEALVAEDIKTGQIVSLVGGVDFSNPDYGQINYAQTKIPPGSSFKPYDYASLINYGKNVGAGSVLYDTQAAIPGYPCTNKSVPDNGGNCLEDYDFRYPGPETLRYALAGSRNVPAVKAMLEVGVDKVINTADTMMGDQHAYQCYTNETLTKPGPCYGSAAIGDGAYLHLDNHVNGLSTLARLGDYIPKTYILNIKDASGKTIEQWKQAQPKQVIKKDSAYIVDNMLSDPNATYLPGSCSATTCTPLSAGGYKFQHYNGWKIAVKTGTTNDNFDGLMTAWTTKYAVVSWVGYHTRNVALRSGGMEYLTEPLTRTWIEGALDTVKGKPVNWTQPSDIKTDPAYVIRYHVGLGSIEPSPNTDIYPASYQPPSGGNTSDTIDKVSGKLATSCTPADAKMYISNSNADIFSVDTFVNGGGQSTGKYDTTASDDVHNCSDQKPNTSLTIARNNEGSTGGGNAAGNGTTTCGQAGCTVTITVSQGTHPLTSSQFPGTIQLSMNGNVIKTFTLNNNNTQSFTYNYQPANKDAGKTVQFSAQTTDSVLYQSTASESVTNDQATTNNNGNNKQGKPIKQ